ncbi:MAG: class IV adenylate cyclase [Actinobacteria bacterium]|nr:class IV adenylate cyclase [Actinomycetota bacterium]MBU1943562.1 class IV adenylate cyclase [Actinomycetota bacterium]MBU2688897.1 class IV adenylate cyclase [Actinomycetota bacterium]
MRNVELKARLDDPDAAERIALRLSGSTAPRVLMQVDTYFVVPAGRLKLREADEGAELIYYHRGDTPGPKESQYRIVPVGSPGPLKELLGACLGVKVVVRKTRRLYLVDSVRIHIDEVEGLGSFLEFEALLGEGDPAEDGYRLVRRLISEFDLVDGDLIAESYGELID